MKNSQQLLLKILSDSNQSDSSSEGDSFIQQAKRGILELKASERGLFFVDVAFAISCFRFIQDERWLQVKKAQGLESDFKVFMKEAFALELSSLSYVESFISGCSESELQQVCEKLPLLEEALLQSILQSEDQEIQKFVGVALGFMGTRIQEQDHVSLYRSFDALDQVLGLDYEADSGMKAELTNSERLYEGAGVGVQSSYSTLFTALDAIQPSQGSRFIDLGSGYGRAGFVVGFMRPDIEFIGYEYVPHRVNMANECSRKLGLDSHVQFLTQDLSLKDFKIPEAEVYYMFDPFSEETYHYVLGQLIEISRRRSVTIATKGNARLWLRDVAKREGWSQSSEFDGGNLCLFQCSR